MPRSPNMRAHAAQLAAETARLAAALITAAAIVTVLTAFLGA